MSLTQLRDELREVNATIATAEKEACFTWSPLKRHECELIAELYHDLRRHVETEIEFLKLDSPRTHEERQRRSQLETEIKGWDEEEWNRRRQRLAEKMKPTVPAHDSKGAKTQRVKWAGTVREFGDWILDAFRDGKISAASNMNALEQLCEHFEQRDGSPMNARSIMQNLNNRYNEKQKAPSPQSPT